MKNRNLISSEYNPVSGITTNYYHQYGVSGKSQIVIQRVQDAEPILNNNKALLNAQSSKSRKDYGEGIGVRVASIPMGKVEELAAKGLNIMNCSEKDLKKFLNDPDNANVRTAYGRL